MATCDRVVRILIGVMLAAAVTLGAQQSPTRLPAYRGRVLGVFDANTGEPIEGALVTDVVSKMSALTTKTGTVSLVFLPDSGSIVRVQKIGYQPATMVVRISPEDTLPITMLHTGTATTLPAVVTKDSAPKFLSPGLREFEERRKQGMGHYITEAQLRMFDALHEQMQPVLQVFLQHATLTPGRFVRRYQRWERSAFVH